MCTVNETVDDCVGKMQQFARSIKADEKMVHFAILKFNARILQIV